MSVSKRLLALMSALVVALLVVAGCGGGGASSSSSGGTLTLGNIGWQENVAVANLTKVVLEEDLDYDTVELKTLDVGLLFEGVAEATSTLSRTSGYRTIRSCSPRSRTTSSTSTPGTRARHPSVWRSPAT